jgi:carboxymethylenebutenolidase
MRIELPSGTPAELVVPEGVEPSRGVVLLPDIMGLRPLFDDHVARLSAATGWAVVAPEPFPNHQEATLDERFDLLAGMDDSEVLGDLVAAADAIGCETVGVMGFCMGGMYALKASGTGRFHRSVSCYGMIRVPERWQGSGQRPPLSYVEMEGACPVMAIVGTEDHWTPPADVDALEAAGAAVVRYEGADHGFIHDPERPAHRPDDAADAWRRALDFLGS